jgi:hypothetical protein
VTASSDHGLASDQKIKRNRSGGDVEMSGFSKGDKVVLTENIGGFLRTAVKKGTVGVVVEQDGWPSSPMVKFDNVSDVVEVCENEMR